MSILKQSLVEKAGYDNGFEYVLPCTLGVVNLGSAHHFAKVAITILPNGLGYSVNFMQATNSLLQELIRQFSNHQQTDSSFLLANEALLAQFLKRTSELAQSLVSVQPYHIESITHLCKTTPFKSKGVFLWLLPIPDVIYLPNNTTTM